MKKRDAPANKVTWPTPFEHLFVATDFSAGAAQAVSRAAHLAVAERGTITVAHVLSGSLPKKVRAEVEEIARRSLDQATKGVAKMLAARGRRDIRVTSELCHGLPYVALVRQARSVGADLVVLGRHGKRPIRDMFIGSTAERVIRAGDLPVLVVSRRASRPYRRPLVAIDLEDTSRSVVTVALRALGTEAAAVTMVHAYPMLFDDTMPPRLLSREVTRLRKVYRETAVAGLSKLQEALGALGVRWRTVVVPGDARAAILGEAVRLRADLLTVGTHGRSGISHVLVGSVAERVIRAAACDVLVARPARVSFRLP